MIYIQLPRVDPIQIIQRKLTEEKRIQSFHGMDSMRVVVWTECLELLKDKMKVK